MINKIASQIFIHFFRKAILLVACVLTTITMLAKETFAILGKLNAVPALLLADAIIVRAKK